MPDLPTSDLPYEGPLKNVRVIDFTHVISGPFSTQILADLGAEVVKIEDTGAGDVARALVPLKNGLSHHFAAFNRNKRSVALDLKSADGREVAQRLLERADVLVENFSPGVMERLGFGPDTCRAINPGLIYTSISGFGRTGPLAHKRSLDLVAQAYSGVMSTNGTADGPPLKLGVPMGDTAASLFATIAITSALLERRDTGKGKYIDIAMFDSLLPLLANLAGHQHMTGGQPPRVGSAHYFTVPYGAFEADDGSVVIAAYTPAAWTGFCEALELPGLVSDPRFALTTARSENRQQLFDIVCPRLRQRKVAEVLELMDAHNVPCAPIHDIGQAFAEPHTAARSMVLDLEHPVYGKLQTTSLPLKDVMRVQHTAPPLHGEHTAEVMRELGFDEARISRVRDAVTASTPAASKGI